MEVEHHLFVVEHGLPYGAILHFHVSSRECNYYKHLFGGKFLVQ